jgi:ABC-type transport system substrate-binding protein
VKKLLGIVALIALLGLASYFFLNRDRTSGESTVNLRLESFALSLTPSKLTDTESRRIATLLHLGLIRVDQDGLVRPGIAEKWEKAGGVNRFSLKANVTFNDGSPLTPEDVITSLCQSMQPASLYAWSLASIKHEGAPDAKSVKCTGIRAVGSTIEIEESSPVPWLLEALSGPAGWIVKKGAVPAEYGNIPGAGAYRLAEVRPDSQVVLKARANSALPARAASVTFNYIADDAVAATKFRSGELKVLELNSPNLIRSLDLSKVDEAQLKRATTDKLRVVVVGEEQLARKGLTAEQISTFKRALVSAIDRNKVATASFGLATSHEAPYIAEAPAVEVVPLIDVSGLPKLKLTVISESDAFSDLIAATLPKAIGAIEIDYKGVDKGLLISSIVKREFDLASVVIEATLKAPVFWTSFFNPKSPFVAFGKPLPGTEASNPSDSKKLGETLVRIRHEGNWIGVARENKLVLTAKNVTGVRLTPAGQTSYEEIGLK